MQSPQFLLCDVEFVLIPMVALAASALTLFSGFGLGTLLMPAFALFFPVPEAVAMTAIVHLFNNLFKLVLLGKQASRDVVVKFGVPAVIGAAAGAALLAWIDGWPPLWSYTIGTRVCEITTIKLVVGAVMIGFAFFESCPQKERSTINSPRLVLGGVVSGFFGGLSGHQGALRSMFLLRAGLEKSAFIASGVVIACMVDLTRLSVYGGHFAKAGLGANVTLLTLACGAAFAGAFLGARLLSKATLASVRAAVVVMLVLVGVLLTAGVV